MISSVCFMHVVMFSGPQISFVRFMRVVRLRVLRLDGEFSDQIRSDQITLLGTDLSSAGCKPDDYLCGQIGIDLV